MNVNASKEMFEAKAFIIILLQNATLGSQTGKY